MTIVAIILVNLIAGVWALLMTFLVIALLQLTFRKPKR